MYHKCNKSIMHLCKFQTPSNLGQLQPPNEPVKTNDIGSCKSSSGMLECIVTVGYVMPLPKAPPGASSVVEHTFFDAQHAARVNQVQEERVKLRDTVQLHARTQNARWLAQQASLSMGPSTFTVDPGDVKVSVAVVWHQELRNLPDSACPCLLGADKLL